MRCALLFSLLLGSASGLKVAANPTHEASQALLEQYLRLHESIGLYFFAADQIKYMDPDDESGSIYKMSAADQVKTMLGIIMKMPVGKMVDAMSPILPEADKNLIKEELDFSMEKWGDKKMRKSMGEVVDGIEEVLKDKELNDMLGKLQTEGNKILTEENEDKRDVMMKQTGDLVGSAAEKLATKFGGAVNKLTNTMEEVLDGQ